MKAPISDFALNALREGVDITALVLQARKEGKRTVTITTSQGTKTFRAISIFVP